MNTYPIFRADHVGSFLRPQFLLDARAQFANQQINIEQLREIENKAIVDIVKFQEQVGIRSITDGEFRRTYFHLDFLQQLGGVTTDAPATVIDNNGKEKLLPPNIRVTGKVKHVKDIQLADFKYLNSQITPSSVAKVTIPSPTMLHFRGGRNGIDKQAYPVLEPDFYNDVAQAYAQELIALHQAGCRHVQMDDTNLAYLCDEKMREAARKRGDDPNLLPFKYAEFINKVVNLKPKDLVLTIHLCRGNFKSTFAASGHYGPVAEALLSEMNLDGYFLEYDDDRSGGFEPLKYLPKGKIAILGLISSKFPQLENQNDIKRRIDQAAKYASIDQLALSPQCGFSSTVHGNNVTLSDQKAKLQLTVEIAQSVWGSIEIH
ncbi:5-methyltetrahydropteroyltriglutamate--homocysteine S-methyltransferase [Frischella sp. Ac13]|uniref:5-methyltetrahydropteroyltriglutamate--homocysteine S-methyltransferase n=1 Tax=Frischella japonica TaxID=2741544 RepID=A0ABR7QYI5_9GAMM|nr:5-methyltetrahydropteroyltriglutamate--homocysteine S-methyltransferase [Frischella japonica]MBC9131279.1 5-methyltetrahydropteroyltriglutamate--homocysteine S-methyltransferase [Frischella japonica]